ncbi:MAG: aldo/keto reductase [Acidimicrobiales bacterium]
MRPRLGLGAAPLGNLYEPVSEAEARATVDAAWAAGIRDFDVAPLYGHGLAERRLGDALRGRPRDQYRLSTKVGRLLVSGRDEASIFVDAPALRPVFDFSYDGVTRSFEASLERLGLDRIDTLLVHDPDDFPDEALAGAFPALRRLRDEKVVSAIGAGMNQAPLLGRFVREADIDCVLVAGRWSLLDRRAGDELLPLCQDRGVEVMVGGVFNSGLLARPSDQASFDYAAAPPAMIEAARRLESACRAGGIDLVTAAVRFPTRHPAVTTVLVGARSAAEVRASAAAFTADVPDRLWERLDREAPAHRPTA